MSLGLAGGEALQRQQHGTVAAQVRGSVEAEREQSVLMPERTGYEVDKLGTSKGGEKKRGAQQEGELFIFPFTHAKW